MAQTPQQTYYVFLAPMGEDEVSSLRPIARLLQEEEESVAGRMKVPTFQILRRYARKGNAESFANQLKALGLKPFVVSDGQIGGHLFLWAKTANQGAGGMAIVDHSDQPLYTPFDDVVSVCIGPVKRQDGAETLMVDLHRVSSPVTPRIDTAFFDFGKILGVEKADAYEFLEKMKEKIPHVAFDFDFAEVGAALEPVLTKGIGRLPGEFPPPDDVLGVPYDQKSLKLFGVYSFLTREIEAREETAS